MLWRQRYDTKILRDLACPAVEIVKLLDDSPPTSPEVWIGGFGFQAIADQGVWWRLFQSDFANDPLVKKVFIFPSVQTTELETIRSLVAPSELPHVYLIGDPVGKWRDTLEPFDDSTGFAAIIQGSNIPLAMVGPPTEEAWDVFHDAWASVRI